MIKKFLITGVFLSGSLMAEMKPLLNYLEDIGDNVEASNLLYVQYRCLGLYGMVTNVTSGSTDESSKSIASTVGDRSLKLIEDAYAVWRVLREDKSFEDFQENLKISVQPLADNYQKIANENWLNSGAYFEGNELIVGDLSVCGQLAEVQN